MTNSQPEQPKGWRDVLPVHPAADLFPMMSKAELLELGEDIKKNGLRIPIVVGHRDKYNREFKLWDGRNRLDALDAIGLLAFSPDDADDTAGIGQWHHGFYIKTSTGLWPLPVKVLREDEGNDPCTYIVSANIHRRHLSNEQKRELIAKLIKAVPEKSNRQIAEKVKADHKTVGQIRKDLESTGEIPQLKKTVGADGKSRARPRPAIKRPKTTVADKATAPKAVNTALAKDGRSSRVLAEFKVACRTWLPKLTPTDLREAIAYCATFAATAAAQTEKRNGDASGATL